MKLNIYPMFIEISKHKILFQVRKKKFLSNIVV